MESELRQESSGSETEGLPGGSQIDRDGLALRMTRLSEPGPSRNMYVHAEIRDHTYFTDFLPGQRQRPVSERDEHAGQSDSSSHESQRRPSIEEIAAPQPQSFDRKNAEMDDSNEYSETLTEDQQQPTTEEVLDAIDDLAYIKDVCLRFPELRSELIEVSKLRDMLFLDLATSKAGRRNGSNDYGE